MPDDRTPDQVVEDNLAVFMEDGPRLSTRYGIYVEARDDANGMVLLGGLGAMGCGIMWQQATPIMATFPGWDEAEQRTCDRHSLNGARAMARVMADMAARAK